MTISIAPAAALSQRQRNRLRQVEREWIKQREAFLRTNKTNLPRSEPASSVPWWTKIKSNSRRLRLICKKSHCQASVIRMCCKFVVESKVGVDDRNFSSSPRTDREWSGAVDRRCSTLGLCGSYESLRSRRSYAKLPRTNENVGLRAPGV